MSTSTTKGQAPIEAFGLGHTFRGQRALEGVSLSVASGEIHAVLGPNGAGKTTLLRVLAGLIRPSRGRTLVGGIDAGESPRQVRELIGLMPSGERTLYYRISGVENLVFFGRLQGLSPRDARGRALDLLADVGLDHAGALHVGSYSNGMKKRLSFARALLVEPDVLLIDEATHDLDPEGASRIRDLARTAARRGAAILWATQRLEEIRGFADRVTLLADGEVRFQGSVSDLEAEAPRRYLLHVRNGGAPITTLLPALERAVAGLKTVHVSGPVDSDHYVLWLREGAVLGEAVAAVNAAEIQILSCREERAPIEQAFLLMTRKRDT
jgi:ABC-2 type transport system ATP-binding protein